MPGRLKVLISAYACSPFRGSEPGVGWGIVAELAKHHELWVIVEEEKFREDIEKYLAGKPELNESLHFLYIRKQRNKFLRRLWPPSYYWYYRRWHWKAFRLAERLNRATGFDLAHQLNMVGFREPGFLWRLNIPFVWGPIGGMGYFPWRFLPVVGWKGAGYYLAYNLFNFFQTHFLSRPKKAAQRAASGLLAATPENRAAAMAFWGCSSTILCEVGLPCAVAETITLRQEQEPLRLIWTGLHTCRKALNLALSALSLVPSAVTWELHILGEGEKTNDWKNLAAGLGISGRCFFHGWLPRNKALEIMATGHVMLLTSLRDLTATVTVEALAMGVPIVCLDHCGFGHVVNDSCGIKIPVTSPAKVSKEIAVAIERLAADEDLRQELARGALVRARDYSWAKKAEVINGIYQERLREAGAFLGRAHEDPARP